MRSRSMTRKRQKIPRRIDGVRFLPCASPGTSRRADPRTRTPRRSSSARSRRKVRRRRDDSFTRPRKFQIKKIHTRGTVYVVDSISINRFHCWLASDPCEYGPRSELESGIPRLPAIPRHLVAEAQRSRATHRLLDRAFNRKDGLPKGIFEKLAMLDPNGPLDSHLSAPAQVLVM